MMVWRMVNAVKPGRGQDFVDLLQEMWGWLDSPVPHRIYVPISGPHMTVVQEMEFEDSEERQRFMSDMFSRPEWPAARDRWFELVVFGGSDEFFRLVE